jgi:hypothetical protein
MKDTDSSLMSPPIFFYHLYYLYTYRIRDANLIFSHVPRTVDVKPRPLLAKNSIVLHANTRSISYYYKYEPPDRPMFGQKAKTFLPALPFLDTLRPTSVLVPAAHYYLA